MCVWGGGGGMGGDGDEAVENKPASEPCTQMGGKKQEEGRKEAQRNKG